MEQVEYARGPDGTHVAYRVLPADPESATCNDLVLLSGGLVPMESFEERPTFARMLDGLRSIGRVVIFDRRGLEDAVVIAVDGYGIGSRFAARYADAARLLVLYTPVWYPPDEWNAWTAELRETLLSNVAGSAADFLARVAPSGAGDPGFLEWYQRAGRTGASPMTAERIWESVLSMQPDDQLFAQITVPTLVLGRRDNRWMPIDGVRNAAARIPNARLVELEGADHLPFVGDVDAIVSEIAQFVLGERRLPPPERLLAAVLFTDLVGSTAHAASIGDAHWKTVLNRHDGAVRAAVGRSGGAVVKSMGDGMLALLPSATAALRAARAVRDEVAAQGLRVRIGIHVGDVDKRGEDVSGLAVHVAARVMAAAPDGEIYVTPSVASAAGADAARFEPAGSYELKGVPGEWKLLRVAG